MATGASTADLAIILVDARKGVLTQTRRHALHRAAARHPRDRAGGEQDGPGRLCPAPVRGDRRRIRALSPWRPVWRRSLAIPVSGLARRQCFHPQRQHALVCRADAARASRNVPVDGAARAGRSRSACRCSGSTARTRTFAAMRDDRERRGPRRRSRSRSLPSGPEQLDRADRHLRRRPRGSGRRAGGDAGPRRRRSTARAAT